MARLSERSCAESVTSAVLAVIVLAAALSVAQPSTPQLTAAEQQLIQWVLDNGGTINVEVAMINNSYRGLVAKQDIPSGGLLAAIPERLAFPVLDTDINKNKDGYADQRGAVSIVAEISNPASRWEPMWASWPPADDVACCAHHLPREYAPLLQHAALERYHINMQQKTENFDMDHEERLRQLGFTLEQLNYAMSMLHTRNFVYYNITRFVPFLDLANFKPLTPNTHTTGPCPSNSSVACTLWQAGEDLKAGEEAHVPYDGMWNDRSLLQYGFLQEPQPGQQPPLIGVDRHDFVPKGPIWRSNNVFIRLPPAFSANTVEGYQAEISRLQDILQSLLAFDPAVALWPASPQDKEGRCLKTLRRFRELRKAALEAEVTRLQGLQADLAAAEADPLHRPKELAEL